MLSNSTCLLSTLHDSNGKLLQSIKSDFSDILKLYRMSMVDVTRTTHLDILPFLQRYFITDECGLGYARRRLLEDALTRTDCTHFHLVDFDRLLYWYKTYPHELKEAIRALQSDKLTIFGRTSDAFHSHPYFQRVTEELANHIFSQHFGDYDILAASRGIPRHLASQIVEKSIGVGPAWVDAEWPMIVGADNIQYFACNGLAYESALFGTQRSTKDEVRLRVDNLKDVVSVICGE